MISLVTVPIVPTRFCPTKETLAVLNERQWICSFSGGKDSTSLVTWIECLRRIGLVQCATPRLVMSDTGVEYPFLRGVADRLMAALTASGWRCEVVTPAVEKKLYCMIFGRGVTPIHPSGRKMRWCTRSTKIDPMSGFARTIADDFVQLSGVRFGESASRDAKLRGGCGAGGECGLPDPGEGVFGPIISWTLCKVIEWLSGDSDGMNELIADLLPMMAELVKIYEVKTGQADLFGPPKISSMRFGCIGCPAITNEKITKSKQARNYPQWVHLRRLYDIWAALYLRKNRCVRIRAKDGMRYGKKYRKGYVGYGPIRLEVRKQYFAELLDIQRQSGVVLVTPEDEAFIRDCWERKVYPRGWTAADELVTPPADGLFDVTGESMQ